MKLPMAACPAVIAESIATTLRAHGLHLSPELLRELGRNTTQSLVSIDTVTMCDAEEPPPAERLAVGETLRALARARVPKPETAPILDRIGEWLAEVALFEIAIAKGQKTAMALVEGTAA